MDDSIEMLKAKVMDFAKARDLKLPKLDKNLAKIVNESINYMNKLHGENQSAQIMRDTAETIISSKIIQNDVDTHQKLGKKLYWKVKLYTKID